MSKQLAVSSSFAIFALSALALFAPGSQSVSGLVQADAPTGIIAPILRASITALPF
ncbi:MAG TPA: hypothetical protein VNR60_05430 [Croceibacterium sp.]|nr:hypothetical protein [Croceibacterium sp.]